MNNSVVPLDKQNSDRVNEGELFDLLFKRRLSELQKQPVVSGPVVPKLPQSGLDLASLEYVLLSYHKECCKRSWTNCAIATCALIISIAVAVVLALIFYDHESGHGKHKPTLYTSLYYHTYEVLMAAYINLIV